MPAIDLPADYFDPGPPVFGPLVQPAADALRAYHDELLLTAHVPLTGSDDDTRAQLGDVDGDADTIAVDAASVHTALDTTPTSDALLAAAAADEQHAIVDNRLGAVDVAEGAIGTGGGGGSPSAPGNTVSDPTKDVFDARRVAVPPPPFGQSDPLPLPGPWAGGPPSETPAAPPTGEPPTTEAITPGAPRAAAPVPDEPIATGAAATPPAGEPVATGAEAAPAEPGILPAPRFVTLDELAVILNTLEATIVVMV